jgi:hypothetical protein
MPTTNHTAPGEPHLVDEIAGEECLIALYHDASVTVYTQGHESFDSIEAAREEFRQYRLSDEEIQKLKDDSQKRWDGAEERHWHRLATDVLDTLDRAENAL